MKRTYVNRLPKGENGTVKYARIENGQLIVDVEFEKKFEPKDGDFLTYECCNRKGIFIFKNGSQKGFAGCYCGISSELPNNGLEGELCLHNSDCWESLYYCRPSKKEEIDFFLNRIKCERKKRWNAEKKCLEDIRWRAEKNGLYYFLVFCEITFIHSCIDIYISRDNIRYYTGNYFKTREAAQKVADEIQKIFKNSKAL